MSSYPIFQKSLNAIKSSISLAFFICVGVVSVADVGQNPLILIPKSFSPHAVIIHIRGREQGHLDISRKLSETNDMISLDTISSDSVQPTKTDQDFSEALQLSQPSQTSSHRYRLPEEHIQKLLHLKQGELTPALTLDSFRLAHKITFTGETTKPSSRKGRSRRTPPLPPNNIKEITRIRAAKGQKLWFTTKAVKPLSLGKTGDQFFTSLARPRPTYQALDDLSQPKQRILASTPQQVAVSLPNLTAGKRQAIMVQSQKQIILDAWIQGSAHTLALPKSCETELKEVIGQKVAPAWFTPVCEVDDILYVSIEQSKYLRKP